MNLTVYVPKDLEEELKRRAEEAGTTPSLLAQSLIRSAMERPASFSAAFAALAGSWEDSRTPSEIIADVRAGRTSRKRPAMR